MFRFKTSHLLLFPLLGLIPAQSFAANFSIAVAGAGASTTADGARPSTSRSTARARACSSRCR